ncbi:hypothetical protein BOX15_Mlig013822g1 [Macrostomum lignano]|uniref:RHD domain-containing protein n=1 Tax=Macrostomum lignano TaxID=282301 RepID=A0A267F5W5_9PLAT|nr:hypothetical protein BOX15_Mlig013822g1 [Macrostomum lignano]
MHQQQQQQLLQLLASVTNHPTSTLVPASSSPLNITQQSPQQQQLQELNEARIQLAIRQAVNPLSSASFDSASRLTAAPQPLYSNAAASATVLSTGSTGSSANTVTNAANETIGTNGSVTSNGVTSLLQSLASQTAQMQGLINVLMAQQQQQPSIPDSLAGSTESLVYQQQQQQRRKDAEHVLLPAMSSASISSLPSSVGSSVVSRSSESSNNSKPETIVPARVSNSLITNSSASAMRTTAAAAASVRTSHASSTSPSVPTSPSPSGSSSPPADAIGSRGSLPPAVGVSLQASGLPSRLGPFSLSIVAQPEANHRARYLTEGSRGSVKDRFHRGYPAVQLTGCSEPVQLCIFVAADSDRLRPHSHYQACKVAGKTTASRSTEVDCEGTRVLVVNCDPRDGNVFSIDCIGILKLRNVDVGIHGGVPGCRAGRGQKRSYQQQLQQQGGGANTQARLVFRVCLGPTAESAASIESAESGGVSTPVVLQVVSDTIVCTQPVGSPEVLRASSTEGPCHGGSDLFLIGKNFARGSRVIFREVHGSDSDWEAEAAIEPDYFTQAHLICRVPAYRRTDLAAPITVQVTVRCEDRRDSEPFYYTYKPALVPLRMASPGATLS